MQSGARPFVIAEPTNAVSLLNVFISMKIPGEPGKSPPFGLYVQLTDGLSEYLVTAVIQDMDGGKPLTRMAMGVPLADRLSKVNFSFAFDPVTFPTEVRPV